MAVSDIPAFRNQEGSEVLFFADFLHDFCQTERIFHVGMECPEVAVVNTEHVDMRVEMPQFRFAVDFPAMFPVGGYAPALPVTSIGRG